VGTFSPHPPPTDAKGSVEFIFYFFSTGGEASLVIQPLHTEEGSAEFTAHLP
jgi:hypothetical protein